MAPESIRNGRGLRGVAVVLALGAVAGAIVWASLTLLAGSGAPPSVPPIGIGTSPAMQEAERMERQRRAERREQLERRRAEQRRAEERREAAPPAATPAPAPAPSPAPAPVPAPAPSAPAPDRDDDGGGDD